MAGGFTQKVLEEHNAARLERQALAAQREREMRESCPALKAIDLRIARAARAEKTALPGLYEQRERVKAAWLADRGLPHHWLTPPCDCAVCRDTGFAGGRLCACVRNEATRRMFSEAGLTAGSPDFGKFDPSLFPTEARMEDGRSLREAMERLRDLGVAYAERFPELQKPNMLFYGKPGRGKTFLMDCIAGRVISRGFWTVRATAFTVNDVMAKALFGRADPDDLFECDLLVLDDLGSEPLLNKVTISSLFNLLNERSAKAKPFLVSTNLTPEEILKRYGDRVFSRMTDSRFTRIIEFEGIDLRKRG